MAQRTLSVVVEAITSDFERGMRVVVNSTEGVRDAVRDTTGGLNTLSDAFKVVGLAVSVKQLSKFASEAFNASDTIKRLGLMWGNVTKGMGKDATDFATTNAKAWGVSEKSVKESMAKYYALLKARGISEKDVAELTKRYTKQSANYAGATGQDLAEATNRVSAIIRGEYDSVENGFLSLSQTMLNDEAVTVYAKKWDKLTEAERAYLKIDIAEKQYEAANLSNIASDASETWANMTSVLEGNWKLLIGTIGTPVLKALAPVIKGIADAIKVWAKELKKGNPLVIAVTVAVGIFVTGMIVFTSVLLGATVATAVFGATMAILASPITLIIGVIAILVGSIVLAWKTNEGFRNFVIGAWNSIKLAITTAWAEIKKAWSSAGAFFSKIGDAMVMAFKFAINTVKQLFENSLLGAVIKVVKQVRNLWNSITGKKTVSVDMNSSGGSTPKRNAKGGIFQGFSKMGNNIFGESGHEAVIPLSPQGLKPFAQALGRYGNSGGGVNVENLYVRNDADIQKVAQELDRLQKADARKKGFGYGF